ncbi:MAG: ATP-dependent zinc protease [Gammaproteobacteria bacterium]|nr:ATP-dependent zinc protease [Gammaproteobacteria bacterium]
MENKQKIFIGWKEWCALPDLNIMYIRAKIDTGAKTSSLHAYDIHEFYKRNQKYVSFNIHPIQNNEKISIPTTAKIIDERYIMSSNGHKELRYVIATNLILGSKKFLIQLTLSNRDPLRYRMLLGRDALTNNFIIDPGKSHCLGRQSNLIVKKFYLSHHK